MRTESFIIGTIGLQCVQREIIVSAIGLQCVQRKTIISHLDLFQAYSSRSFVEMSDSEDDDNDSLLSLQELR